MTPSAKTSSLLVVAATLLGASSTSAGQIANYSFDSGTTGWFVYNTGTGAAISNPSDTTLTPAGGTAANALAFTYTGSASFRGVASNFNSISLNDGDKLLLSMDFRFTSTAPSSGTTLSLFLGNETTAGAAAVTDKAYAFVGSTNGTPATAFHYDSGSAATLMSGSDRNLLGTPAATAQNIGDTGKHTLNFSIERSGADYILSGGVDGNSVTYTQVAANQFSFNVMGLGIVANTTTTPAAIAIDNVTLSSVPEPSTSGLMGAGALVAVALVRRRRRSAKPAA